MKITPNINNNFSKLILTHSDIAIYNYFHQASKNLMQLSPEYHKNNQKINILINDLTQRHIMFRDALLDPLSNKIDIQNHFKYLFSNSISDNAQLRGLQCHLSSMMYRDFGLAGNNIVFTNLSADYLGTLVLPVSTFNTTTPTILSKSSPFSFQQGLEVVGAQMYSSVTPNTDIIHVTADNPASIIKNITYSLYINNMPSYNINGDFFRETNFSGNIVLSSADAKNHAIGLIFNPKIKLDSKASCVGAVDPVPSKKM
jgi:hypothetical protein